MTHFRLHRQPSSSCHYWCFCPQTIIWVLNSSPHWLILSNHHMSAELKSSLIYSLKSSYECWTQVVIDLFSQIIIWVLNSSHYWLILSNHHLSAELKSSLTYSLKSSFECWTEVLIDLFSQIIIWVLNSSPHWFILSLVFFRPSYECWPQVIIDLFSHLFSSDHHMNVDHRSSLIYSCLQTTSGQHSYDGLINTSCRRINQL